MSKKRKRQQPQEPIVSFGTMPTTSAMSSFLRAIMEQSGMEAAPPLTVSSVLAEAASDTDDIAGAWGVRAERACCGRVERDGVVLLVATERRERQQRAIPGRDHDARFAQLVAVSEHDGCTLSIVLDAEALRQLANRIGDAVSFLESGREGDR